MAYQARSYEYSAFHGLGIVVCDDLLSEIVLYHVSGDNNCVTVMGASFRISLIEKLQACGSAQHSLLDGCTQGM